MDGRLGERANYEMKRKLKWKPALGRRAGIALIIVLGFLSILIIMATALLTLTRTERLVSESAQDDTRSRQFLRTALASAMSDVSNYMWGKGRISNSKADAILLSDPPVELECGGAVGAGLRLFDLNGWVDNWVPARYLRTVGDPAYDPDYDAQTLAAEARWVRIEDPLDGRILGRYAFMCFDCTGQLDANLVSDGTKERKWGKSIAEIKIDRELASGLPVLWDLVPQGAPRLVANRNYYARFDSLSEIMQLNDGNSEGYYKDSATPPGDPFVEELAIDAYELNNLAPYSLCYDNGWWDWSNGRWVIEPKSDVRGWSRSDAQAAFTALGYPNADKMAACFGDYVDSNYRPQSTDGGPVDNSIPCNEPIPMLNEVLVSQQLTAQDTPGCVTNSVFIEIELWYPFPANHNPQTYRLVVGAPTVGGADMLLRVGPSNQSFSAALVTPPAPATFTVSPGTPFIIVTARYDYAYNAGRDFIPAQDYPIRERTRQIVLGNVFLEDTSDSNARVDRANLSSITVSPFADLSLTAAGTSPRSTPLSYCANDPRMNLNNTAADRWTTPFNPTPGAVNALPGFNRVGGVASGDLEGTNLYVRNSADLDSVAELGFIHAGAPWTTINLFDERGRQLLMRYRTTNLTARYTDAFAGSINPNTLFTNVLIAAFINTPINDSPSGTVVRTVDEFMARDIVGGIFAANRAGPAREGASGWMTTTAFAVNGRLMQAPYNLDNTRKESIIRNTYRLFNANQNLFVFVVVAQTINDQRTLGSWEPNYDQITSEKRAVAIVWRDPFPVVGSNPLRHQMFVRTFKFLDE